MSRRDSISSTTSTSSFLLESFIVSTSDTQQTRNNGFPLRLPNNNNIIETQESEELIASMFDKQSSKSGDSDLTAISNLAHHNDDDIFTKPTSQQSSNSNSTNATSSIGNDPAKEFQAFSVEFDEIDDITNTQQQSFKETQQSKQHNTHHHNHQSENVFTKELRACDFQLTYMKREYKKEQIRFEFVNRVNVAINQREKKALGGQIKCMTMNNEYFIVGGRTGNFLAFQRATYDYEVFETHGTMKEITCLAISDDSRALCIADIAGSITVYDMRDKKVAKILLNLHAAPSSTAANLFHAAGSSRKSIIADSTMEPTVVQVNSLVIMHNLPGKLQNLQILSSDNIGNVKATYLNKGLFKYSSETKTILERPKADLDANSSVLSFQVLDEAAKLKLLPKRYEQAFIDSKIVATLSLASLHIFHYSIITLRVDHLFELKNMRTESTSSCSGGWGEGYVYSINELDYKTTCFAIGWDNYVHLVRVLPKKRVKGEEAWTMLRFEPSCALKFDVSIVHVGFVADSILLVIDRDANLFLFNTNDLKALFLPGQEYVDAKTLAQRKGCPIFPLPITERFQSQISKQNSKNSNHHLNNLFVRSKADQEVLFFAEGKIAVAALAKWNTVYNHLIETGEWRQAMHYLTNIYYSNDKLVTNLPSAPTQRKQLLEDSVKIVANKYLQMCLKVFTINNDDDTRRNMVGLVVEFAILTENFEILFNEIQIIVEEHLKSNTIFMECLVPFIRRYKIKFMPQKSLMRLIEFLEQNSQHLLIEKLLIQLDTDLVESNKLIEICIQKRLIKPLIYICTKGADDVFIAPLSKLWGHYLTEKYSPQSTSSTTLSSPAKQQQTQSTTTTSLQSYTVLGLRSLWYARLCLKGRTITNEAIPKAKYDYLVCHLAEWVFDLNNLLEILLLTVTQGFEIITLFFNPTLSKILNSTSFVVNKRQRTRVNRAASVVGASTTTRAGSSYIESSSQSSRATSMSMSSPPTKFKLSQSLLLNSSEEKHNNEDFGISPIIPTTLDEFLDAVHFTVSEIITSKETLVQASANSVKREYYLFLAKLIFTQNPLSGIATRKLNSDSIVSEETEDVWLDESMPKLLKATSSNLPLLSHGASNNTLEQQQRAKTLSKSSMLSETSHSFHLNPQTIYECIVYFIQNQGEISKILDETINQHLKKEDQSLDPSTPIQSSSSLSTTSTQKNNEQQQLDDTEILNSQVLQHIFSSTTFDTDVRQDIEELILQANGLTEIKANLYASRQEFRRSIDTMMSSKNPAVQRRSFPWLTDLIVQIKQWSEQQKQPQQSPPQSSAKSTIRQSPSKPASNSTTSTSSISSSQPSSSSLVEIFESAIESNFVSMVRLDAQKSQELIHLHFSHIEARLIRQMKHYPDAQLNYIERSLEDRHSRATMQSSSSHNLNNTTPVSTTQNNSSTKDLLTVYIELLCQYRPNSILSAIEKYDGDIDTDACLLLCMQFNVKDAQAFIYEKNGNLKLANELYLGFFDELAAIIKSKEYEHDATLSKFNEQFKILLRIAKKSVAMLGQEEGSNAYFDILDRLSSYVLDPPADFHSNTYNSTQTTFNNNNNNSSSINLMSVNGCNGETIIIGKNNSSNNNNSSSIMMNFEHEEAVEVAESQAWKLPTEIENIFYAYIKKIVLEMQSEVDMESFAYQLTTKHSHLSLGQLAPTLLKILGDLEYTLQTYNNTNHQIQQFTCDDHQTLSSLVLNGISGHPNCAFCQRRIAGDSTTKKPKQQNITAPKKTSDQNGWIVEAPTPAASSSDLKDDSSEVFIDGFEVLVFKCGHVFHGSCYVSVRNQMMAMMSEKKSMLFEIGAATSLCYKCLSATRFMFTLLLQVESRSKKLNQNSLLSVLNSRATSVISSNNASIIQGSGAGSKVVAAAAAAAAGGSTSTGGPEQQQSSTPSNIGNSNIPMKFQGRQGTTATTGESKNLFRITKSQFDSMKHKSLDFNKFQSLARFESQRNIYNKAINKANVHI